MKKILFTLAFLMFTGSVYAISYYDAQHFEVVPDTPNVRNDWYFRGGFHIVKSTSEARASECPIVMSFNDDGTFTVIVSSAVYAENADLLDGYNYDYFASTTALQAEIDARISADSLLGSATNQIRIDFEAYDAELNTSTNTLRTDLTSEINTRISEDNLISDATGQIRIDFEAYDSELNTSTTTLRADLTTEINNRINEDSLLGSATGQLRLDLINEISSLTTTYLGLTAKANDSDLLDGYNYDHFVDTVTDQIIYGYKTFLSSLTAYDLDTSTISFYNPSQEIASKIYWDEDAQTLVCTSSFTATGGGAWVGTATSDLDMNGFDIIDINSIETGAAIINNFTASSGTINTDLSIIGDLDVLDDTVFYGTTTINGANPLYLNEVLMKSASSTSLAIYMSGTRQYNFGTAGFHIDTGHLEIESGYSMYFDGGGDTRISEIAANTLQIFVGSASRLLSMTSSEAYIYGNFKPAGAGSYDQGNVSNYWNNLYAANYPSVSRKSLKQDIVYFDSSTITSDSYDSLPRMAEYYYIVNADTDVPKNLGYVLDDDDEEEFGDLPYVYEAISNEEIINQVSVNSLIAFICELIKHLNSRVEVLEAQ